MADLAVEPTSYSGFEVSTRARVLRAEFGDGYSQRAADGINTVIDAYQLEWEHLDASEHTSLVAQLESAKGVTTIDWTPHDKSTSLKFTCSEWSKQRIVGNIGVAYRMNATLIREFDL